MPPRGTVAGRGICPRCGREQPLTMDNLVQSHRCPLHPCGHTQQPEKPLKVLKRTYVPPRRHVVDHFWYRAGFGL
jgi:hypothetical protein